jgi:hypothetical protein
MGQVVICDWLTTNPTLSTGTDWECMEEIMCPVQPPVNTADSARKYIANQFLTKTSKRRSWEMGGGLVLIW